MSLITNLLIFFLLYSSTTIASELSIHPDGFYYLIKRDNGVFQYSYKVVRALKNSEGQFFSAHINTLPNETFKNTEIIGECNPQIENYGWRLEEKSDRNKLHFYIVGKTQIEQKEVFCIFGPDTWDVELSRIDSLMDWQQLQNTYTIIQESPIFQYGHFKVGSMVKIRAQTWNQNKLIMDTTYQQRLSYIHPTKNTPHEVYLFFDGPYDVIRGQMVTTHESDYYFPNFQFFLHDHSKQQALTYYLGYKNQQFVEIEPLDTLFKAGETVCFIKKGSLTSGLIEHYTYSGYFIEGAVYQDSDLKKISDCR